ncbi:ATP phosphoribosyltransferase regulatory subunit [Ramlibacter tataouinensis]|uniref:ATP phosphoribosyltransferase regulatory subunit n=1 Tax=Ramlibacter tataouinensis (strain ATCC BAA-407 / DSM 14655 / LMG 21543 / TTB310) TaxID=365046 RepID=F5XX51_RAMTT|nr:ATP phosphoribosyltransferase regulatory subunit [Ramlibacter tataouinensis]AEG92995.1 Candidate ATP phosphoribosyltransferase regulatory subunit [Ramlibacter tataouinensis TTB310]
MSAWVLPDHIADVLPSEARHIEELRRLLLDTARGYGCEQVMPPLLEHLESLLTGTGEALDLQTFKLVDQLSGRMMGLRADTTPQVARIDAHLLNRRGVTRLCYCGPVLHTRPGRPHATREPLQFGAEIYGHAGLEADLEALTLALDCLRATRVADLTVDLADARIVRALLAGVPLDAAALARVHAALAAKDASELAALTRGIPAASREGLAALLSLYGDQGVLDEAEKCLPPAPLLREALANLRWLASQVEGARISFDLADLRGYAYYSGARFAVYTPGASDALVRGGRYDEVGAVFGRNRPAVGFSLDLKELVGVVAKPALKAAIRAPWGEDAGLRAAIAELRRSGETVVCVLPGHESEVDEFHCDRELARQGGGWAVRPL